MFRTGFPDLQGLKRRIAQMEKDPASGGWPNVIINSAEKDVYRPDVKGTLSIFCNIKGKSFCAAENHKVRIDDDYFFVTNQQQPFTLEIPGKQTETFNIHFSTRLVNDSFRIHTNSTEKLLDNMTDSIHKPFHFNNQLHRKDQKFQNITNTLYKKGKSRNLTAVETDELLYELASHLFNLQTDTTKRINHTKAVKTTTKAEINKRLSYAVDYIRSHYDEEISLEAAAHAACLSKFHFLRLFKSVYACSPYQFVIRLRLEKSAHLLQKTTLSTQEIAFRMGYKDESTFCRAFYKMFGQWPQAYRKAAQPKQYFTV